MNNLYWSGLFLFLAVALLLEGIYLAWSNSHSAEARQMQRRLQSLRGETDHKKRHLSLERTRTNAGFSLDQLLSGTRAKQINAWLAQSGLGLSPGSFLALTGLSAIAIWMIASLWHFPVLVGAILGLAGAALPFAYIHWRRKKRISLFEQQLPDGLDLISRALRAGHTFSSGIQMVSQELPQPISGEFQKTFDEISFGVSIPEALTNLVERVPSTDLRYFVLSLLIQRDTGGNLAELLDNLSRLIRDRLKLLGTIRVLSAEGRLSALILTILPFGVAGLVFVINKEFMSVLWQDPLGIKLLTIEAFMMVAGIFWMWRMVNFRV